MTEPDLSIACLRYRTEGVHDLDGLNRSLLRRLVRETKFLPSATAVDGEFAIRPCFINVRTKDAQVEAMVEAIVRLGDELAGAN